MSSNTNESDRDRTARLQAVSDSAAKIAQSGQQATTTRPDPAAQFQGLSPGVAAYAASLKLPGESQAATKPTTSSAGNFTGLSPGIARLAAEMKLPT